LRKWARVRAVSPLHDPETRKELVDDLAWLWEEVRMALVALGKAREAMEALEEEDRLLGVLYAWLAEVHISALRPIHQEKDLSPPSTPSTIRVPAKLGLGWA
jgi:hypothetical protein